MNIFYFFLFQAAAEPNYREIDYSQDVRKLKRILQNQILQKETIIHEIKVLSLKGRPLPPIPQSIIEEVTKSTTVQSHSRDSDDLASNECQMTGEEHVSREPLPFEESPEEKGENSEEPKEEKVVEQESEGTDSSQDDLQTEMFDQNM